MIYTSRTFMISGVGDWVVVVPRLKFDMVWLKFDYYSRNLSYNVRIPSPQA